MTQLDLCDLIRRDHEELVRALAALVDPSATRTKMAEHLDLFRVALEVHAAAEAKALEALRARATDSCIRALIARDTSSDHDAHRRAATALLRVRPGTDAWHDAAGELEVAMLEHVCRTARTWWTVREYAPQALRKQLAVEYANERMKAATSPSRRWRAARRSLQRA
jgi:hypothetical protein